MFMLIYTISTTDAKKKNTPFEIIGNGTLPIRLSFPFKIIISGRFQSPTPVR
jgi:hypothetical protein